jgi:protein phosphatase
MGTTLVMALVHGTNVAIAHVGDSRLYRLSRRQGLEQITVDHEVGQREIQRGVEPDTAYARPDAYQLTQALGPRDENFISPDIQFFEVHEDTILLLCSDGLSDHDLLENHWQTHLEPLLRSQAHLEQGVIQLIELANQYNGHDNITAVAIRLRVRPNLAQLRQLQGRR